MQRIVGKLNVSTLIYIPLFWGVLPLDVRDRPEAFKSPPSKSLELGKIIVIYPEFSWKSSKIPGKNKKWGPYTEYSDRNNWKLVL